MKRLFAAVISVLVLGAPVCAEESTLADQKSVEVTAYNNNLALVKDRRAVTLKTGEISLRFGDVAAQIKPETVSLRSISQDGSIQIFEQNYEYDLMSPEKLMEKYVGKKVKLVNFSNDVSFTEGARKPDYQEAELLSMNNGPIFRVNNEIYLGHPGNVVLPEIPENLIAKPSLIWVLNNAAANQEIEVTYLTGGLQWTADYVITLDKSETALDLKGWVTLNNQSGAQYTNAKLQLVAGEVNIATPPPMPMQKRALAAAAMEMAPQMHEEAFSEYHLYTLERPATIKDNQSKQVSLLTAQGVKVEKKYEYRGEQHFYFSQFGELKDQKVAAMLKFRNDEKNKIGMPLPAGIMRVYQPDSGGSLQFSGEDRIGHTPKDEDVTLKLGNAFDVVAERKQTDFKMISNGVYESAFEIKIRNHKTTAIKVDVVEPMTSDWRILEKSHDFVKRDAFTAVFTVDVPKDGETTVTYRVQVIQK
jgi:hypothetical protein